MTKLCSTCLARRGCGTTSTHPMEGTVLVQGGNGSAPG